MPDPVKWADLLYAPEATARSVVRRVKNAEGSPGPCTHIPMVKGRRGSYRRILYAHPFDELRYRMLVGAVASDVDLHLGDEVTSYRLADSGPEWYCRDYRYGIGDRQEAALAFISSDRFGALGILDISDYYSSIDCSLLEQELGALDCDSQAVGAVVEWLFKWQETWGVKGLPVGPEGSGILGNAALASLDHLLRAAGVPFQRYTDDIRLYLSDPERWWGLLDEIQAHLISQRLLLNTDKVKLVETPRRAIKEVTDPTIEAWKETLRTDEARGIAVCSLKIEEMAGTEHVQGQQLRYALGVVGRAGSPGALEALRADRWLLDLAPRHWGRYLREMRQRRLVDPGELITLASGTDARNVVGNYHALLAAAARALPRECAAQIEELALSHDPGIPVALRCAATHAWGKAEGVKHSKAVEAALATGDPQHQRALILTLSSMSKGGKKSKALRKLRAAMPDWAVTINWASLPN